MQVLLGAQNTGAQVPGQNIQLAFDLRKASVPRDFQLEGFSIEINSALARGGGAVLHEPEEMAHVLQVASFTPKNSKINIQSRGWVEHVIRRYHHLTRNGTQCAALAVAHYQPVFLSLSPPYTGEKAIRPLFSELKDDVLNLTLTNPFVVGDMVTMNHTVAVYAKFQPRESANSRLVAGGLVVLEGLINDQSWTSPSGLVPMFMILRDRAATYASISCRTPKIQLYNALNPIQLDSVEAYREQIYWPTEARLAPYGSPMSVAVPTVVAGAPALENQCKAFDARAYKNVASEITLDIQGYTVPIPFIFVGVRP